MTKIVSFEPLMRLSRQMSIEEFHSRYQYEKIITKTRNSTIRLSTHVQTGQQVIIKSIFTNTLAGHQKKVDALVKEINTLYLLRDNKHVTQIYDVVFCLDTFYIVLEYADSGDLFNYIRQNNRLLSETEIKHFFRNIVKIVAYVHTLKLAHRDLKLENILLDQSGRVMLADFGFSTSFNDDGNSLCSSICGTVHYEPPEIVRGDNYNPFKSDAWSLGVILYLLMFKEFPFNSPSITDTIQLILTSEIKFPETIEKYSDELRNILSSLLDKNPNTRKSVLDIVQEHSQFFGFCYVNNKILNNSSHFLLAKNTSEATNHDLSAANSNNTNTSSNESTNISTISSRSTSDKKRSGKRSKSKSEKKKKSSKFEKLVILSSKVLPRYAEPKLKPGNKAERIHNAALNTILCTKEEFNNLSVDEMISYQIVKRRYQLGQMKTNSRARCKTIAPGQQYSKTPRGSGLAVLPRINPHTKIPPLINDISIATTNSNATSNSNFNIRSHSNSNSTSNSIHSSNSNSSNSSHNNDLNSNLSRNSSNSNFNACSNGENSSSKGGNIVGYDFQTRKIFTPEANPRRFQRRVNFRPMSTLIEQPPVAVNSSQKLSMLPECDNAHKSSMEMSVMVEKIIKFIEKDEALTILCQEESGVYVKSSGELFVLITFGSCGNKTTGYSINKIRGDDEELSTFESQLVEELGF
ncbi:hypothetical protein TRFO_35480 [Tritrichomonas foetus]|uniref:Protein kinase domain-containing protein n=1 Tax=Tritrichomonas foetus TaxID=1144522 RepID=A0A1J4JG78_9EUKA|nr:hypothetical protein [Tritrichomonas foetus]OHS98146.1 hypothetical protein TRFO_35480 [Tritrichomonas foetus]|eukprot:OHS98146.1 hypothetical protein TRFO_35480 [Tritrichomonas foetus]